jgi:hypothetical protein
LPSSRLFFGRPRAFKGELRINPGVDHFDIYDGPSHEAVVADEIEFLHRHLLGRSLCGTTKAASELPRVDLLPALTSGGNPGDAAPIIGIEFILIAIMCCDEMIAIRHSLVIHLSILASVSMAKNVPISLMRTGPAFGP